MTTDQGLTSNFIQCLVQDNQGFLWIGTDAGLNRFDGKNVIKYTHIIGDSNSLLYNRIKSLFVDDKDQIWVGTYAGLSILNPRTSKFTNYRQIQVSNTIIDLSIGVNDIAEFDNRIYVVTNS